MSRQRLIAWIALTVALLAPGGVARADTPETETSPNRQAEAPDKVSKDDARTSPEAATDLLVGEWKGTWHSVVREDSDKLRCTIEKIETPEDAETEGADDGLARYRAVFNATFWKVFKHRSVVTLKVDTEGRRWEFEGEKDLGLLAGGVYTYKGFTDGETLYSTFRAKSDHGTYELERVEETADAEPDKAAPPATEELAERP